MKNNQTKLNEWINDSVKSSDKFYHLDYPNDRFHALGMNGAFIIASTDKDEKLRKQFNISDPKLFKKEEDFEGVNPFYESTITFTAFNLDGIFSYLGFDRREQQFREEKYGAPEMNLNPYFIIDDKKEYYQRGYVWSLEQKQALINSIYRGLECGRLIVHSKSYDLVNKMQKLGYTDFGFRDIVDGKQRISTIIDFILDKFPDEHDNYYSDLSNMAKRSFGQYKGLLYGEMKETSTPEQIANAFLNNAAQGTPISKEHIEFMLKIKESLK